MKQDQIASVSPNSTNAVCAAVVIRANTPKEFDITKHRVTKFKRDNYEGYHTIDADGYYTYKGMSGEASIHYSEGALLGMSNTTVVNYNCR